MGIKVQQNIKVKQETQETQIDPNKQTHKTTAP